MDYTEAMARGNRCYQRGESSLVACTVVAVHNARMAETYGTLAAEAATDAEAAELAAALIFDAAQLAKQAERVSLSAED